MSRDIFLRQLGTRGALAQGRRSAGTGGLARDWEFPDHLPFEGNGGRLAGNCDGKSSPELGLRAPGDEKGERGTLTRLGERCGGVMEFLLPSQAGVIEIEHDRDGCRLTMRGGPTWRVSRQGVVTAEVPACAAGVGEAMAEAVRQGPVEVVARALRGEFCLHASAVQVVGGGVVAFVGESGAGKSTLARLIHQETAGEWQRVSDDILPVRSAEGGMVIDPSFPQPKLLPFEQFQLTAGFGPYVLVGVYQLERPEGDDTVSSRLARGVEAVTIVAGNTVGTRLFDRRLLGAHLKFCAELAAQLPVRKLRFPRQLMVAARVIAQIACDLGLERSANGRVEWRRSLPRPLG